MFRGNKKRTNILSTLHLSDDASNIFPWLGRKELLAYYSTLAYYELLALRRAA